MARLQRCDAIRHKIRYTPAAFVASSWSELDKRPNRWRVKNCQFDCTTVSISSIRKSAAIRVFTRTAYVSAQIRKIALTRIKTPTAAIKLTRFGSNPAYLNESKITATAAASKYHPSIICTTRTNDIIPNPSDILANIMPRKIPAVFFDNATKKLC